MKERPEIVSSIAYNLTPKCVNVIPTLWPQFFELYVVLTGEAIDPLPFKRIQLVSKNPSWFLGLPPTG